MKRRSLLAAALGLVGGTAAATGAPLGTTAVVVAAGPRLYTCEMVAVFAAEHAEGDYLAEWPPYIGKLRQTWEDSYG